jgi:hypothetical protein
MSLAIYAAPFNEEINDNNIINKKRQTHNKTQKKYNNSDFDTEKVNNVLQTIHENLNMNTDEDMLGNFSPPPKPESAGVEKTISTEQMTNRTNQFQPTMGKAPEPSYETTENLDLNNFNTNYGDNKSVDDYYKKFVPNYKHPSNQSQYAHPAYPSHPSKMYPSTGPNYSYVQDSSQELLIQKLNYMIHLLEEKQDEKTNNVTEEIVLYSFLGIFIIFIVDSFARIGKYVR